MKKKTDKKLPKSKRPFAIEFLETIPETELENVTGGITGGIHTNFVSLFPRPDHG